MEKDYYKILGVSKNASDDDIKRAYRKLAIKYHPDKQNGKSDSEKKEAEEKFKEINEANDILSDPQKRKEYDTFGTVGGGQHFSGGGDFEDMNDILRKMREGFGGGGFGDFFNMGRGSRKREPEVEPGATIQAQMRVTVEDLFNGGEKEFTYEIDKKCPHCNGKGGEGVEACSHCKGTGMINDIRRTAFGTMQSMHPCQHCGGTGFTVKNKCHHCGGTGFVKETKSVKVNIPRNLTQGQVVEFKGQGYESKNGGLNGDLLIQLVIDINPQEYRYQNGTLYKQVNIPYYTCVAGGEYKVTLPNKKEMTFNVPSGSDYGTQIKLYNCGSKVDFIVIVKPSLPKNPSEKEKELAKQIQKLH